MLPFFLPGELPDDDGRDVLGKGLECSLAIVHTVYLLPPPLTLAGDPIGQECQGVARINDGVSGMASAAFIAWNASWTCWISGTSGPRPVTATRPSAPPPPPLE